MLNDVMDIFHRLFPLLKRRNHFQQEDGSQSTVVNYESRLVDGGFELESLGLKYVMMSTWLVVERLRSRCEVGFQSISEFRKPSQALE